MWHSDSSQEGDRLARPSERPNTSLQPQRGVGESRYCGTPHRRRWDLCQQAHQLNIVDDPPLGDLEDSDRDERDG